MMLDHDITFCRASDCHSKPTCMRALDTLTEPLFWISVADFSGAKPVARCEYYIQIDRAEAQS